MKVVWEAVQIHSFACPDVVVAFSSCGIKFLQPSSNTSISGQPSNLDRTPDTQLAAAEH